ncbi:MAG: acyltransferase [Lachnospiraceae bacterium]|nr:acyltransferase [Lachnospiraceae bacterium]
METKNRIGYVDIARGIAICCIVLGHLGVGEINRIVFTFHVPLFFFLSGFFMNNKYAFREFVRRKARNLLVPYFVTCLVLIVLAVLEVIVFTDWTNVMALEGLYGNLDSSMLRIFLGKVMREALDWMYAAVYGAGDPYTSPFYIKSIGAIWFLWASFWANVFMRKLLDFRKEVRITVVGLLFFAGYFSRRWCWLPLSIQAGCCATFFVYLGFLAQRGKATWEAMEAEVKLFLRVMAFIVWISFIRDFKSFWLVHCDVGRGIVDIVGCICGCYMIFLLSGCLERYTKYLARGLRFLGRYSLFILCIHTVELHMYPWDELMNVWSASGLSQGMQMLLLIVTKFGLIILATFLCSRSAFVRKIFGITEAKYKA